MLSSGQETSQLTFCSARPGRTTAIAFASGHGCQQDSYDHNCGIVDLKGLTKFDGGEACEAGTMSDGSAVTASSSNPSSAGAGITGGYEGDSLALKVCIAFFLSLAIYNVLELLVLIFGTFQK